MTSSSLKPMALITVWIAGSPYSGKVNSSGNGVILNQDKTTTIPISDIEKWEYVITG